MANIPKPRWARRLSPTCIEVLACLGNVPQSRADVAKACGMMQMRVADAIVAARAVGWDVVGSYVKGYTLSVSRDQRAWLEEAYDRLGDPSPS